MKKKIFGILLQLESLFLVLTSLVSLIYKEKDWWVFLLCAIISFTIGAISISIKKWEDKINNHTHKYFSRADSFMVVALTWVLFSIIGMIPFIEIAGMGITDAFFETMSGFTTTGSGQRPFLSMFAFLLQATHSAIIISSDISFLIIIEVLC